MFFQPQNNLENSLKLKISSRHAQTFRFLFWQKQFKLISNDSSTWFKTWQTFYETDTIFINLNHLNHFNAFIVDSSNNINDNRLFHDIHIDVIRLSRYFQIFTEQQQQQQDEQEEQQQNHIKRLERILFLFSQYNSANGYNQGFHEILIILYFVTINGGIEFNLNLDHCEAITYFLLHALINGTILGDIFMIDQNSFVLFNLCEQSSKILRNYDSVLAQTIQNYNLEIILFAIPWIKILFTSIYPLQLTFKLWDLIFTQIDKFETNITFLIVAHIVNIRNHLIDCNFSSAMIELNHHYIETDIEFINICKHFNLIQRLSDIQ
jgi:hypothetical protein